MKSEFLQTAQKVSRRLFFVNWLQNIRRTALFAALFLVLAIFLLRALQIQTPELIWGGCAIGLWILISATSAWIRRPQGFAAISYWDEAGQRRDAISSAYFFEEKGEKSLGESLHVEKAHDLLQKIRHNLNKDVQIPNVGITWIAPILALGLTFLPWMKTEVSAIDLPPDEATLEQAKKDADELDKELEEMKKLAGLKDDEQKRLDDLLQDTKKAIEEQLKQGGDKSLREAMEELEKRAREAEKMAKALDPDNGDPWASEELLTEMKRHPDLADIADQIQAKDAKKSAQEARKISESLRDPKLTQEVENRLKEAISKSGQKATPDDLKKPVGEHIERAGRRMEDKNKTEAADEFANLAEKLDQSANRQESMNRMKNLAQQLRQAGNKLAGKRNQGLQKLAKAPEAKPGMNNQNPGMNPNLKNLPDDFELGKGANLPGMENLPQLNPENIKFQKGKGGPQVPVPGQMLDPANLKNLTLMEGDGMGGPPKFAIPIPGAGMIPGNMPGNMPSLAPGMGSAGMAENRTDALAADGAEVVAAQIGNQGDVAARLVQGNGSEESAMRMTTSKSVEFLAVQEQALDQENLPPSRRDHVKQYFYLLKDRFDAME